jgi:methionine synthase II (cobalamin-independent)
VSYYLRNHTKLLNTDCGFAANVSLDEVYTKLKNEVAAAQQIREKHGS